MTKLFLDMDGVLVNFIQGVIDFYNLDFDESQVTYWNCVINAWKRETGKSSNAFWAGFDEEFWIDLQPTKEFGDIMEMTYKYHPIILTSPPIGAGVTTYHAVRGKTRWIKKHLPELFFEGRWLIGPNKCVVGHPNTILIDDSNDNCYDWDNQGGLAIMMPRPWNKAWIDSDKATEYVRSRLWLYGRNSDGGVNNEDDRAGH